MLAASRSRRSPDDSSRSSAASAAPTIGGRDGVREEVRPRALAQQLDHLAAAGDVPAAGAADRLAQGAGEDVHAAAGAGALGRAAAARAEDADGVRVVDHDHRVVALGEVADRRQVRDVAVHREHAVRGDQPAARAGRLLELRLQIGHVAVAVAQPLGLDQADAVDDRRVVQLVGDHGVVGRQQHLEQARVGVEAGAEQDRVLGAQERGDPLLQPAVDLLRAADEPHRREAEAPLVEGRVRRVGHRRVARQAEVVVGAEVDQLRPVLQRDPRPLARLQDRLVLLHPRVTHGSELRRQLVLHRVEHSLTPSPRSWNRDRSPAGESTYPSRARTPCALPGHGSGRRRGRARSRTPRSARPCSGRRPGRF